MKSVRNDVNFIFGIGLDLTPSSEDNLRAVSDIVLHITRGWHLHMLCTLIFVCSQIESQKST